MIALIPARAGSKRLPNKNILAFCGKPLIWWTIRTAINSTCFSKVYVSTEDTRIMDISAAAGASIINRPAELATDKANSLDVIYHALTGINEKELMLLQPTSPLRTEEDIWRARSKYDKESKNGLCAIVSVTENDYPSEWLVTEWEERIVPPLWSGRLARQKKQTATKYKINGAIFCGHIDYIKRHKGFVGPNTFAYLMPPERSIDIDTLYEFQTAEMWMLRRQENQHLIEAFKAHAQ